MRTRRVRAATAAIKVSGSWRGRAISESPIQTESKPAASARSAMASSDAVSGCPDMTASRVGSSTPNSTVISVPPGADVYHIPLTRRSRQLVVGKPYSPIWLARPLPYLRLVREAITSQLSASNSHLPEEDVAVKKVLVLMVAVVVGALLVSVPFTWAADVE